MPIGFTLLFVACLSHLCNVPYRNAVRANKLDRHALAHVVGHALGTDGRLLILRLNRRLADPLR